MILLTKPKPELTKAVNPALVAFDMEQALLDEHVDQIRKFAEFMEALEEEAEYAAR